MPSAENAVGTAESVDSLMARPPMPSLRTSLPSSPRLRTSSLRIVLFLMLPLVTTRAYAEPPMAMNRASRATAMAGEGMRRRNRVMAPEHAWAARVALQRKTARERLACLLPDQLVEPGDLVRRHRVSVLLRGVLARPHLVRERTHALDHLVAHAGVALHEPGDVAVVDPQQVVENENLPVRSRPGA